jgi:hypothetical protein
MKTFNPMNVLWTVSQSLFIMPCPHPKDALLEDADDYSVFLTPHYDAMSSGFLESPGISSHAQPLRHCPVRPSGHYPPKRRNNSTCYISIQNALLLWDIFGFLSLNSHSYQCACVLHAILLPLGYLTLSTPALTNSATRIGLARYQKYTSWRCKL